MLVGDGATATEIENARRQIVRWANDQATPEPASAVKLSKVLGTPPDYFDAPAVPPSTLFVVLERLVRQLREDETALQHHPEEAAEAIEALRRVSDVTGRFAEALEAALEALPGDTRADAQ
jgi:transcriptional regulator with XRE-family HTH domain